MVTRARQWSLSWAK